jgi:hypothetical protein
MKNAIDSELNRNDRLRKICMLFQQQCEGTPRQIRIHIQHTNM